MADPDVRIVIDRRGLERLANSAAMGQAMVTAAAAGEDFLNREAPERTGAYKAGITVSQVDVVVGGRRRRGARLAATDPKSQYVEWVNGTHVLARAVDAIEKGR